MKPGHHGRKTETEQLERLGATPTANSGAGSAKGDGRLGTYMVEIKSTVRRSIPVHREVVAKLRQEARMAGKKPMLVLSFADARGHVVEDWVAVPRSTFEQLEEPE